MTKGALVCVEGLDGCGKTTQTKLLVRGLRKMGYDAAWTAEPSQGNIGRFIRKYFLHCEKRGSSVAEALLFAADRVEHLEKEAIPLLKEGKIVISDRYMYSSLAYQGSTGLDLDWIKTLNKYAICPDLAIFIDVDPATVVKRLKTTKSVMENLETLRKVREVYMKFVDKNELLKIDGTKSIEAVAEDVLKTVSKFLKETFY